LAVGYFHVKAEFKHAERPFLHKGKTAEIFVNGKCVGFLGELDYQKRNLLDLKESVYLAEISLAELLTIGTRDITFKPLERFHPVHRDLSIVLPSTMNFSMVEARILKHEAIERADLIDIFRGGNLAVVEASLTFSVKMKNNKEKAMSESDINSCMSDLIKDLTEGLKLRLR
jgi:phenylalanyl-tRNA synthetase beta chain